MQRLLQQWARLSRRLRLTILSFVGACVVWIVGGFFVLPHVTQSVLQTSLEESLGRPCRIGGVTFNPFTLALEVHDAEIQRKDGKGVFVSFGSIHVAPDVRSIWYGAPIARFLTIRDVAVTVDSMGGGQFNFSDLLEAEQDSSPDTDRQVVFPFAVRDFILANGSLVFNDLPGNRTHVVRDVTLQVPFASGLFDDRESPLEPLMSATVNDTPVQFSGHATPFGDMFKTEFTFTSDAVGIADYWQYMPVNMGPKPQKGTLSATVHVAFIESDAGLEVRVSGVADFADVAFYEDGTKVFGFDALRFDIARFALLDQFVHVSSLTARNPYGYFLRTPKGGWNWQRYIAAVVDKAVPQGGGAASSAAHRPQDAQGFTVRVDSVDLDGGRIEVHDRAIPGGFRHTLGPLRIQAGNISTENAEGTVSLALKGAGTASVQGTLGLKPVRARLKSSLRDLDLTLFVPYIHAVQPLLLDSGKLGLDARVDVTLQDSMQATVEDIRLTASDVALRKQDKTTPSISVSELTLEKGRLAWPDRSFHAGALRAQKSLVRFVREKRGTLDLPRLLMGQKADATVGPTIEKNWTVTLANALVEDGECIWEDETLPRTGNLGVHGLTAHIRDISSDFTQPVAFDVKGEWVPRGTWNLVGSITLAPLNITARGTTHKLNISSFNPYIALVSDVALVKGVLDSNINIQMRDTSLRGLQLKGLATLHDVLLRDAGKKVASLDALTLQDVQFDGHQNSLSLASVDIAGPSLTVVREKDGMLNVQRLLRMQPMAQETQDATAAKQKPAATFKQDGADAPTSAAQTGGVAELRKVFSDVQLGGLQVKGGSVQFKDVQVAPAFEMTLDELVASLSTLSLAGQEMAQLQVEGRLNEAPLVLKGSVNPLRMPPHSDVNLQLKNLDLVPFSPYSLQALAYPVQRGRLNAAADMKTEDWLLKSDLNLRLQRFDLGAKDTRPGAPNYPVGLGLALLRGPNGDITISLPVKGRLDDPEFRLSGLVVQALGNMIMKAMISPFTLLGSLFGGGESLDFVDMSPGQAVLDSKAQEKIASMAKALSQRPGLELELSGIADPERDRQALEKSAFALRLKVQKYLDMSRSARAETTPEEVLVPPEEYVQYLRAAYEKEPADSVEDKPLGLRGVVKEQSVEFMENFLRQQTAVSDEDLQAFALERAKAVYQAIGELQPKVKDRLFLVQSTLMDGEQSRKKRQKLGVSLKLR